MGVVVALLVIAAVGAGIATGLFWIGGKSEFLTNFGLGLTLTVPIVLYGYSIYYFFAVVSYRIQAQQQQAAQSGTPPAAAPDPLTSLSERSREDMERLAQRNR